MSTLQDSKEQLVQVLTKLGNYKIIAADSLLFSELLQRLADVHNAIHKYQADFKTEEPKQEKTDDSPS